MVLAQSCPTLCDPMDCSPQAPLSMEFSRQEYCSGLPFPSPGQQCESAISIHISLPSWASLPFPYPAPLRHHGARSWAPCAVQQLPTGHLLHTWWCRYASATLPVHPTLSFPLHGPLRARHFCQDTQMLNRHTTYRPSAGFLMPINRGCHKRLKSTLGWK